jgi:hypothetical protein
MCAENGCWHCPARSPSLSDWCCSCRPLSGIGIYAVVFGTLLLALGFRLRTLGRAPDSRVPAGNGLGAPVR